MLAPVIFLNTGAPAPCAGLRGSRGEGAGADCLRPGDGAGPKLDKIYSPSATDSLQAETQSLLLTEACQPVEEGHWHGCPRGREFLGATEPKLSQGAQLLAGFRCRLATTMPNGLAGNAAVCRFRVMQPARSYATHEKLARLRAQNQQPQQGPCSRER